MLSQHVRLTAVHKLLFPFSEGAKRREALYDRLYALHWGDTTTNNYGFAPATTCTAERFQLQMYRELLDALNESGAADRTDRVLEISCGRGGGLHHLVEHLPRRTAVVGLDASSNAIEFCRANYAAVPNLSFICGQALRLPFKDGAFDLVVNVEASHAYGDDARFFREVRRVLRPGGRFLFADYRTRSKIAIMRELAEAAGLAGDLRDITANVVNACELDADRRRKMIRANLPWYARPLLGGSLEGYSGLPGTRNFERFRTGDRMYFLSCMTARGLYADLCHLGLDASLRIDAVEHRRWS